ncbi:SpoIIE family protein phosphatase [Flammeovirga sp. MY04]|uniref:PP2C family protein-serine/threonine phosphatase n=1 Tax=Flammeovirga sp. MY04 TaxID=1191459 RepID=UPI00080637F0|nr:SpoIIE family protein phosphatase [Flammeovirga sp. MY04]ANQ52761.1 SpoIIE family protein phosphatase [Flammeovirga sp. MY04]
MKFDVYNFFKIKSRVFLVLMIIFIAVHVFFDFVPEAIVLASLGLIQLGLVLFPSKKRTWMLHLQVILLSVIVTILCYLKGGIVSPVVFFFIPPLSMGFLFFNIKTGALYSFMIFIFAIGLTCTSIYGWSPYEPLDIMSNQGFLFFSMVYIGVSADVAWTLLEYEKGRNKAEQEIQAYNDEIIQQEEELRQQQEELISTREHELVAERTKTSALEEEQRRIKAEKDLFVIQEALKYTAEIQKITLPGKEVLKDFFTEHTILYKPKENISGDFYYVNNYNKTTMVVVGDCKGHAISATLLTMVISGYFDSLQELPYYPSLLLHNLHDYLINELNQKMEEKDQLRHEVNLSIAYIEGNNLIYTSANGRGIIIQDRSVNELSFTEYPIGNKFNSLRHYKDIEYTISPDDVIVMYTDGLTNVGEMEESKDFFDICKEFYGKYESDWNDSIQKYIKEKFSQEQFDDITVLAFNPN